MSEKITAPFTSRQVEILNQYQQSGVFHPYTCGNREHKGDDVLIAEEDGWHCPTCDYTQNWVTEELIACMKGLDALCKEVEQTNAD